VRGDRDVLAQVYTDDVTAWTPAMFASNSDELFAQLERRDDAFTDVDLEVRPLDVGGDYGCVEWQVAMTHSGPLVLGGGKVVEPTGLRVHIQGATVAEFRGSRICSLRQYWDEFAVLEQLGVLHEHG
jgi:ketosteroid isomerase-like protein